MRVERGRNGKIEIILQTGDLVFVNPRSKFVKEYRENRNSDECQWLLEGTRITRVGGLNSGRVKIQGGYEHIVVPVISLIVAPDESIVGFCRDLLKRQKILVFRDSGGVFWRPCPRCRCLGFQVQEPSYQMIRTCDYCGRDPNLKQD